MTKTITVICSILLYALCSAQNTTVHFIFPNSDIKSAQLISYNLKELYSHENANWPWHINIPVVDGKGACELNLTKPLFMVLDYNNKKSSSLFISPGDELAIDLRGIKDFDDKIKISGKGSNNNQEVKFNDGWFSTEKYETDTLPDRLVNDLKKKNIEDNLALNTYIAKYRPSNAYIKARNIELQYDVLGEFYSFKGNHKYKLRKRGNFELLYDVWKKEEMELIKKARLNNFEALISPDYVFFIRDFLMREKEALWEMAQKEPSKFYENWYNTEDIFEGSKLMQADPQNLLTEKIINKYFTGAVAEFAYAHLLNDAIGEKEDNILAIYDRFIKAYPKSDYINPLQKSIAVLRTKDNRQLNEKMILVKNGDSLKTFDEIQELVQGKTVLLDMWGSWCAPCRKEINEHSQALKDHFKGKEVVFMYISNYDVGKDSIWKKLIAYYNLEGMHILANNKLTEHIMKTVKGTGFPTYVVIKKDGSFELSKAGYPMNRKKLIQQIEAAL